MYKNSLFALLLFVATSCSAQTKSSFDQVNGEMGKKIDDLLREEQTKGFSGGLLLVKDGQIIVAKGYGKADEQNNIPFSTQTAFCMGSITKYFTAAAMLKLQSQGKINFADPISKYIANVPADKKGITIKELLIHSAGFPMYLEGGDYVKKDRDQFIKEALAAKLEFIPGSKAVYANTNLSIAAYIIEEVTKMSYEEYLKKFILTPAGMKNTGYFADGHAPVVTSKGYMKDGTEWGTLQDKYKKAGGGPYWNLLGNGGLYTTLEDMYKWYSIGLNNKAALTAQEQQQMATPWIKEDGNDVSFGYGCNVSQTARGTKVINSNGSNGIYTALMSMYPDEHIMFYLATNKAAVEPFDLAQRVKMILFNISGQPGNNVVRNVTAGGPQQDDAAIKMDADKLYKIIIEKGVENFKTNFDKEVATNHIKLGEGYPLYELGKRLVEEKKAPEAIAAYQVFTVHYEGILQGWEGLGDAYLLAGNKAAAKKNYEKALTLRDVPRVKEKLNKLN